MKELTIEQKAKAYDEAIKRVENIKTGKCKTTFMFTEGLFEHIFPELKEDEEIRKAIIEHFAGAHSSMYPYKGFTKEQILAWIEKQGGQKDILEDAILDSNEDGLIADTIRYKREKQGEQKLVVIPKFRVGDVIQLKAERLAPNEDTKIENTRKKITGITDRYYTFSDRRSILYFEQQDSFELVEQSPAWSKEDENLLKFSIENLKELKDRFGKDYGRVGDCINFLKSLKDRVQPQSQWMPSDEQMASIRQAVSNMKNSACYNSELVHLLQDLEKLREE